MGYRSDVKFAVYAKDQEQFKGCIAHWILTGHLPFHEETGGNGSLWDSVRVIKAERREPWERKRVKKSKTQTYAFGLLFETEGVKWYQGYPAIDAVENMIKELEGSSFEYEFVRVGESQEEDVEMQNSENAQYLLRPHVEILVADEVEEIDICIADYVTNQSTIGDQRSDTQPASTAESVKRAASSTPSYPCTNQTTR